MRNSKTESAGVSSTNNGLPYRSLILLSNCAHSCGSSCPLLIFVPSISQVFEITRLTNCTFDISRENNATGMPCSTAIFFAIDNAKAVFPMAGRAARITKSEFCHPDVILSKSRYPEAIPDIPSERSAALCNMS